MDLICDHPNNQDLNNFINPVTIMKPKWLESVQNKQSKFRKEQRKIKRENKILCEKQKEDYKENDSDSSAEPRKEKKGTKRKREKVTKSDTSSHEKNHNARMNQANTLKNDDICTVCRQSDWIIGSLVDIDFIRMHYKPETQAVPIAELKWIG